MHRQYEYMYFQNTKKAASFLLVTLAGVTGEITLSVLSGMNRLFL